jgi:hypothetical protein
MSFLSEELLYQPTIVAADSEESLCAVHCTRTLVVDCELVDRGEGAKGTKLSDMNSSFKPRSLGRRCFRLSGHKASMESSVLNFAQ